MKFSKELQEFIDEKLEELERKEREGKVKYYTEEEAFEIMFGGLYAGCRYRDFANGNIPKPTKFNH